MHHKRKVLKTIAVVLVTFVVVFSVISFVFIKMNFDDVFGRTELGEYTAYLRYEDVEEQYDRELLFLYLVKINYKGIFMEWKIPKVWL